MSQVVDLVSEISVPEPVSQPKDYDFDNIRRKVNEPRLPLKRTHTYQPRASTRIVYQMEKLSKDSFEGSVEIDKSELTSVRFNPVTTVVKADGVRLGSSLRKAGPSAKGRVVEFNI